MKVIDPNNTSHTLDFIPRFYIDESVVFELKNEVTKDKVTIENVSFLSNGILTLYFDYTFTNKQRFQIKLTQDSEVTYRGKLLVTEQETQEYKLTEQ